MSSLSSLPIAVLLCLCLVLPLSAQPSCNFRRSILSGGSIEDKFVFFRDFVGNDPPVVTDIVIDTIDGVPFTVSEFFMVYRIADVVLETGGNLAYVLTKRRDGTDPTYIFKVDVPKLIEAVSDPSEEVKLDLIARVPNGFPDIVDLVSDCNKALLAFTADGSVYDLGIGSIDSGVLDDPRKIGFISGLSGKTFAATYDTLTGDLWLAVNDGATTTWQEWQLGCPSTLLSTQNSLGSDVTCGDGDISAIVWLQDIDLDSWQVSCNRDGDEISKGIAFKGVLTFDEDINGALGNGQITGIIPLSPGGDEECKLETSADCVDTDSLPLCAFDGSTSSPSSSPIDSPSVSPVVPPTSSPTSPTSSPVPQPTSSPAVPQDAVLAFLIQVFGEALGRRIYEGTLPPLLLRIAVIARRDALCEAFDTIPLTEAEEMEILRLLGITEDDLNCDGSPSDSDSDSESDESDDSDESEDSLSSS